MAGNVPEQRTASNKAAKGIEICQPLTVVVTIINIVAPYRPSKQVAVRVLHLGIQITHHNVNIVFRKPLLNCVKLFIENLLFCIRNLSWYVSLYNFDIL